MPNLRPLISPALAVGLTLAACGASDGSAAVAEGSAAPNAATAEPTTDASAPTPAEMDAREVTESDRLSMEMALAACDTHDFSSFLRAYGGSYVVRERFTAPQVYVGTQGDGGPIPRGEYFARHTFPISPVDFSWATTESAREVLGHGADPSRLVFVEWTLDTASDGRHRVEWIPGLFEAQVDTAGKEFGDGLGTMVERKGPGGYFIFVPAGDCWHLQQDIDYDEVSMSAAG